MLELHFTVLKYMGVWGRNDWSMRKKIIYNFYSLVVIILMSTLCLTQIARIILMQQSFTDFNDTFFILLSTNFACFKGSCNLMYQDKVFKLIDMFKREYCCIPRDDFEEEVQKKHDDLCRKVFISLLALIEVTVVLVIVIPLYGGIQIRELPYKVLLPYDLKNPLIYWITFIHHTCGAILCASINITNDAVITGFMLQLCAQLDILKHRLIEMPGKIFEVSKKNGLNVSIREIEKRLLTHNVYHHSHTYKIAKTICVTFNEIIVGQFFISALEICVSVYQLSVRCTNTVELLTYVMYLACMLGQFYVYCYFGNEVFSRGQGMIDAVYGIDWTSLSVQFKKDLIFVFLRMSKPLEISHGWGNLIRLTLESFANIIKTSYSAFRLLKSSA